ncbi:MAG: peptidylprolyl isomerase [Bacteroidales bacterium]
MKKLILILISMVLCNAIYSQTVKISTTLGNITIKLYEDTPFHTENFLKLIQKDFYDSLLFHRVIKNFMIQTGDPQSKHAKSGMFLGRGNVNYTIPPEFVKEYFHKKGALSAARLGDNINPHKESSGCQFYIVTGKVYTHQELDILEAKGVHIKFTEEQRNIYTTIGGAPHLDYAYTVFGEVTEGLETIDKISLAETDKNDRPLKDIRIKNISIIK